LPVTAGTILRRIDMLGGDDFSPNLSRVAIRRPAQFRDKLHWPQVRGWITMTIQTPAHVQRSELLHLHHLVDASVAAHATHARINMSRVIEVNVIRQLVNFHPGNGLTRSVTRAYRFQTLALGFYLLVAIHA